MRVGIVGAGAIGGLLAGQLAHGGTDVIVVDPRAVPEDDYRSVRADGRTIRPARPVQASARYDALGDVQLCLVCVKSDATPEVAAALASSLPPDAPVVSFQNGIRNIPHLRRHLGARATGGVVTYNVRVDEGGRRRQTSTGKLLAGTLEGAFAARLRDLCSAFRAGGERLELRSDIDAVIAGKLLVNLSNGVCAATGLGIAQSLRERDARVCYARCIEEGVRVMRAASMPHARVTSLPAGLIARAMSLPDWVLSPATEILAKIDPSARSSTLQDLDRGRPTEIDHLNGAIVALSLQCAERAPLNRLVTDLVKAHERAATSGERPVFRGAGELRRRFDSLLRDDSIFDRHGPCVDEFRENSNDDVANAVRHRRD